MASFEVLDRQGLRLVKATIRNESIRAESGALHYLRGNVTIESKAPTASGFLKAMVTAENIFRPTYTGTGEIYFGPPTFGEYTVLNLNNEAWVLDRGAYVCSDAGINLDVFRNKLTAGIMTGEGLFQTKVEGTGQVVIYSDGPLEVIDLVNDRLVVDGSFAVARQAHLGFNMQRATKSLLGSATSGEGLVSVIEGTGRVYLAPVPNLYQSLTGYIRGALMSMRPGN